jgi:hypothetical protein
MILLILMISLTTAAFVGKRVALATEKVAARYAKPHLWSLVHLGIAKCRIRFLASGTCIQIFSGLYKRPKGFSNYYCSFCNLTAETRVLRL